MVNHMQPTQSTCQDAGIVLPASEWWPRAQAHQRAARERTRGREMRQRAGKKNAVEDFLWEYYPLRSGRFATWNPGFDTAGKPIGLARPAGGPALAWWLDRASQRWWTVRGDALVVEDSFYQDRASGIDYLARHLSAMQERQATFNCMGWHEWAMVYRVEQTRHPLPLRLGAEGTNELVERAHIRCTHFDAFRFFAPDAVALNQHQPTYEKTVELDQPGCIHVTMDLLRACIQLGPLIPGELWIACYDLARDARVVDMAASPYDCSSLGIAPIRMETAGGKAEYAARQKELAARAKPLRAEILTRLLPARRICDNQHAK